MRYLYSTILCSVLAIGNAHAQFAPVSPDGARPGNDIGTGMSLPRSNNASNLNSATTKSEIAPNLPAPAGVESIASLLSAANTDLHQGHTGAAQEALERAESRALDRSIDYGTQGRPAQNGLIDGINRARTDLANNDFKSAEATIAGIMPLAAQADSGPT